MDAVVVSLFRNKRVHGHTYCPYHTNNFQDISAFRDGPFLYIYIYIYFLTRVLHFNVVLCFLIMNSIWKRTLSIMRNPLLFYVRFNLYTAKPCAGYKIIYFSFH